jgi:hypothetical protein
MDENMDIGKILFPEDGELKVYGDHHCATIVDMELDPIHVTFDGDYCIKIDTKKYSHLTLSIDNLVKMIELICNSEEIRGDE